MVSEVGSDPRSGNVFINMGGRYPEHIFTGVIFGSNAARFPGVRSLEGKTITLEGRVRLHKQKPQIIIEERSQIILH